MSAVRSDKALLPIMVVQRNGAIVHVTSNACRTPRAAWLAYSVAKPARTAYSWGWPAEVGPSGIRVNTVPPAFSRPASSTAASKQWQSACSTALRGHAPR
jgi:NAD(P)-dependent dehydrogenase (short-subunit alcohol dehydrogenase family)